MIDPKIFDDLTKRFAEAAPPGLRRFQEDMEKNLRATLQAALAKLDLVTREEFEVQQGVLTRTRAKLESLEQQLAELEAKVGTGKRRKSSTDKAAGPESTDKAAGSADETE